MQTQIEFSKQAPVLNFESLKANSMDFEGVDKKEL